MINKLKLCQQVQIDIYNFFCKIINQTMVKHLYLDAENFDQLILSGVLIEMYKNDIQIHTEETSPVIKFVQGPNVIQNSIEAILRFSNNQCKRKIFGKNAQEEAVIMMLAGICKDIQTRVIGQNSVSEETKQKIIQLMSFWNLAQNEWVKRRFLYCHMTLLTLSFKIQEIHPQVLSKYGVFVQLRRLFIQKLMSRDALQAMFASPHNKYQQFDLFPQLQMEIIASAIIDAPADSIEDQQKQSDSQRFQLKKQSDSQKVQSKQQEMDQERVFLPNSEDNTHVELEHHVVQITKQTSQVSQYIDTKIEETVQTEKLQKHEQKDHHVHEIQHKNEHAQQHHHQNHHDQNENHNHHAHQINHQAHNDNNHHSEQLKVQALIKIYQENDKKEQTKFKTDQQMMMQAAAQQIKQTLVQAIQSQNQQPQEQHNSSGGQKIDMKKSIKQSFSEHLTKPLEYSSKSLAEQNKSQHSDKKKHSTEKEQKVHLKADVIEQAQSQKYVSQQVIQQTSQNKKAHAVSHQQPVENKQQPEQKAVANHIQQKPPQSQTSKGGPKSEMQSKSKPTEQVVHRDTKQTCKCTIY